MTADLLIEVEARVGVLTLNRPEARNALSTDLILALRDAFARLDSDDAVDVIVLTGADPAFCAGLDLKQLGTTGANLEFGSPDDPASPYPWSPTSKPVIGAVNGVAVTGGLELALACDLLIASERARFADTHARVGVLPGWGMSVLLPLAVGRSVARRMSLTGDFLSADEALRAGLVVEVVAHDELLPAARRAAAAVVSNDQEAVRALLRSYRAVELERIGGGYGIEATSARAWMAPGFDPALVEGRRAAVLERGREQTR